MFIALLIIVEATAGSDESSSPWKIDYEVSGGSPADQLARSGTIFIAEENSILNGRSSLGCRSDGSLIGLSEGSEFDAAITFRQKPAMFLRLKGDHVREELRGDFTASSSDGCFWWGKFTASQALPDISDDSGTNPLSYMTRDVDLVPQPTRFVDPEAFWGNQTGQEKREIFVITYDRNTILMCRNVPMIWQWWLGGPG